VIRNVLLTAALGVLRVAEVLLAAAGWSRGVIGRPVQARTIPACPACGVCPGGVTCKCSDERCPCWHPEARA
jgi:hypothetical protein